ncbi:MAG TPA: substrate-binding domain-containing protein [Bacillota bacterium]|nr:substrate-binding domain-containing protein [Bacillota bacterium]
MKKPSRLFASVLILILALSLITGCGGTPESGDQTAENPPAENAVDLSGKTLQIYCGAGMTKPFEEIAQAFKDATGCEMEVTYANAAQIHTQIKTTETGDLFIAGSAEELAPIQDYVSDQKDLVKHIPVLAVQKGNPLGIAGLSDLAKDGVEVVLGDADATPIGKLANKALSDAGILDKVDVIARTATAPELTNALSLGECDAIIVWKENTGGDKIETVGTTDLDKYIKVIPAASLTFNTDPDTRDAFLKFLDSDEAKSIWTNYGYEILN